MGKERTSNSSNRMYFNVVDGEFRTSWNVTSETTNAEKVIVTNPQTGETKERWVVKYRRLSGYLVGVYVAANEKMNNKEIVSVGLYDVDDDETIIIQFGLESAYARNFIVRLPNVDFSREMQLTAYKAEMKKDGLVVPNKFNMGISIRHRDGLDWAKNPLPAYWTKETPHNMPQMNDVGIDGDWDIWCLKANRFLSKYLKEVVPTRIVEKPWENNVTQANSVPNSDIAPPVDDEVSSSPDINDLPF